MIPGKSCPLSEPREVCIPLVQVCLQRPSETFGVSFAPPPPREGADEEELEVKVEDEGEGSRSGEARSMRNGIRLSVAGETGNIVNVAESSGAVDVFDDL